MLGNFSEMAQLVLLKSKDEMIDLCHPYIGTEHLVLSILKNDSDVSSKLFSYGLSYDSFKKTIMDSIGKGSKRAKFFLHTPLLKKVMENAMLDARDNNNGEVTVNHLMSSLLEEGEGIAIRSFISMGINVDDLYDEFSLKLVKKTNRKKKKMLIDDLGVDLTYKALNGGIDPVVGREKELNRVIEILCRRGKNNPILIGDAGVGKTAIVEELAARISKGNVPNCLLNKRIIALDMASVISGTKYRGEFEERMQKIIREIINDGDIILFIDEVHTLIRAGGAEGAIDAANILKPALARGDIRCIGATTIEEYKKYFEDDKALERRFQKVLIRETNEEETVNILEKLKPIYEKYHSVSISSSVLRRIVELVNKYIYDRKNPDKAIDILDEVCSMVSIRENSIDRDILSLKRELNDVLDKKNSLIMDSDMESAYDYLKKECVINNKINDLEISNNCSCKRVSLDDVAMVISQKALIPVYEIKGDNVRSIVNIEKGMKKEFYGQDIVIKELINTIKRIKLGYSNHRVVSYLFVGPSGVGKTGIAKEFARMFVGNNNLIRLDMSEYSDSMAVNKIIGSAPGYVGYQDQYTVLSKIKDKPNSVIILDEIDKAHPSVLNLLYQILDEGMIRDNKNNTINLNHSIIIMTSNLGFEGKKVGFCSSSGNINNSLKEIFPLSLINRINHVLVFNYLKEEDINKIVKMKLDMLKSKYDNFKYSNSLIKEIVNDCEYRVYGARRIDMIIEDKLENCIIDRLIKKEEINIKHLEECQGTL